MPKKVLVINGHGAKLPKKIQISDQHRIITPGDAGSSYVVSFDNMNCHLEEMTSRGQVWPIVNGKGETVQWHRYHDTDIHDIGISALQDGFDFARFADGALKKKTGWENLSSPSHDVLARGALAVKRVDGQIDILEGDELRTYLQEGVQKTNQGIPLFFCDKELGKIKPMGKTSLSEIYAAVAMIKEFQVSGTEVIVATCSPTTEKHENVIVQTYQSPTALTETAFVDISSPKATTKPVKAKEAFVLVDVQGNNFVDSVEEKYDNYIIKGRNSSGEPRSITIDKDENATGFQDSKELGVVGQQMYEQRAAIFTHFNIPVPDVVKGILPTPKPTPEVAPIVVKAKEAFVLVDVQGNNFVDSVKENYDNYIIKGRNSSDKPRFITIDKDGNATGFQGSKELGVVGQQMYEQRAAIFTHFNIPVPDVVKGILPTPKPTPEVAPIVVKAKEAFVLVDVQGNNFVDSVKENYDNYIIKGRNSSDKPRFITIDKDGNATGFQGSKELGVVGQQMYEQRAAIFAHFNIPVPDVVKGVSPEPTIITPTTIEVEKPPKKEKAPLKELLQPIESKVGKFSNYQTVTGHGQDIPFESKPAQQFLHGLGVPNELSSLSKKSDGKPLKQKGNKSVTVSSFDPKSKDKLVITGARIDRLLKSAKTYVNTDIFPEGHFKEVVSPGTLTEQTQDTSPKTGIHLQNMAVGLCHVQEIDLLATPILTPDGKAILGPRTGTIDVDAPAMLLLSTPALNVGYGTSQSLTEEQQVQYIESMYRTLFHAATSEGREYIALPAAGLGVFGGDPETYFNALMKVAKKYPQLNIIYNSGHPKNAPIFDKVLDQSKPTNIVRTDRDVLIVAHELTQQGKPCAFHNPSDADVTLGINDVGEYWKSGKVSGYVGEEHIGAMSTAPLNSRLLNPNAYQNVVEHSFLKKPLFTLVDKKKEPVVTPSHTKEQSIGAPIEAIKTIVKANGLQLEKPHTPQASTTQPTFFKPPVSTAAFKAEIRKPANMTDEQFKAVRKQIDTLKGEIKSCWPFPNKDRKHHKVDALEELLNMANTQSVNDAVAHIKGKYPDVTTGKYSTRTADLLNSLVKENVEENRTKLSNS